MKRLLFLGLGCLLMASSARAITIAWKVDAWNESWLQANRVDVYLVQSASATMTNLGSGEDWSSDSSTVSPVKIKPDSSLTSYGAIHKVDGKAWIDVNLNDENGAISLTKDSYYALAFVVKSGIGDAEEGHYALTQVQRYTGIAGDNGFLDLSVTENPLDKLQYFDVNAWTSANALRGTPEPTVFALLALGVSGLALRRRVSRQR